MVGRGRSAKPARRKLGSRFGVVTADLAAGACEERSSTLIGSPPAALWLLPDDRLEKRACFLFLA
jgi:hypothetical protein